MVTVGMNYEVRLGQEAAFEAAFAGLLGALEEADGHVESRLYRDVARPRSYLIVSEWRERAAFMAFVRSEAFERLTKWGHDEVLASRPRHRIYDRTEPVC